MGSPRPWKSEYATLQYGGGFRVRVTTGDDGVCILELLDELDLASMARFERVLADVLSGGPRELMFDLTRARFISAQGYAAMGRCSLDVRVAVVSRTELAARILAVYGYDDVMIVMPAEAGTEAPR
jgi:anti-anti-sigma factor